MSDNEEIIQKYPDHIAVIGGGRWARVLIESICSIIPSSSRITVFTVHNTINMKLWVEKTNLSEIIKVVSIWPEFKTHEINAAVVVNAARDHEYAIEKLISENVSVLVEKPVTLSADTTQRLINLSIENKTYFAAAHIFLFASYLESYSKQIFNRNDITELNVIWSDPVAESRYGESKQYDSGLPIIMDWYPHIISILTDLYPCNYVKCNGFSYEKGGALLVISLNLDNILCQLKIERNAVKRQRILSAKMVEKKVTLDFTVEPGFIRKENEIISCNEDWEIQSKPSVKMLDAFFRGVTDKIFDKAIDVKKGLFVNKIIDQSMKQYRNEQLKWLSSKANFLQGSSVVEVDLYYAASEIFQFKNSLSKVELDEVFSKFQNFIFNGCDYKNKILSLLKADSPLQYLNDAMK